MGKARALLDTDTPGQTMIPTTTGDHVKTPMTGRRAANVLALALVVWDSGCLRQQTAAGTGAEIVTVT